MRRRIFTPVSLSDGNHKVQFKYSGGGINNTEFCYENANDSMAKSLDEGLKEKLLFEALAQEDLDEEDIFIE